MVNSKKKMNKSTVAIVVLALLLVLSLVLTATGAWFTDKSSETLGTELKFGHIKLDSEKTKIEGSVDETRAYIMPGDTLTLKISYQTDSDTKENVWVRYKIAAKITKADTDKTEDITLALADKTNFTEDTGYIYSKAAIDASEGKIDSLIVTFAGDKYGNSYQDATVTYSVVVEILQSTNVADLTAAKVAFANDNA